MCRVTLGNMFKVTLVNQGVLPPLNYGGNLIEGLIFEPGMAFLKILWVFLLILKVSFDKYRLIKLYFIYSNIRWAYGGWELIFIVGEGGPPYGGDTFSRGGNGPRKTP